ncbi:MAG: hypothetical protein GEV09_16775 [Pseudonocardiaceae bacterium]|nr:hypothetical protein [Pseudonocardiaceae bacterium]
MNNEPELLTHARARHAKADEARELAIRHLATETEPAVRVAVSAGELAALAILLDLCDEPSVYPVAAALAADLRARYHDGFTNPNTHPLAIVRRGRRAHDLATASQGQQ